ncbi:MAG: hypothetical protein SLAVMIC_00615 [uncultured marine phage]|uniref:Uncharacterized protein n=1 Tax=uncultured marine phage TaxID=707152 RepID=A0A8D9FRP6_9VIRU|nr:MAG: hypothetical protein SLAVMIC_00615 [uncultured marine phage]
MPLEIEDFLSEDENNIENLIKYVDYLKENLEKSIRYTEYLAETMEKHAVSAHYVEFLSKHHGIPSMSDYNKYLKLSDEEKERYFIVLNREKKLNQILGDEQSEN